MKVKFSIRKMITATIISIALVFLWACPFSLIYASGGYGGAGIQQDKGRIDKDKYQLGKAIYNGEFKLPEVANDSLKVEQLEKLSWIQTKLPRPEQRRVNLLSLAGRLTPEQLDALQHFISIRFNVRFQE